MGRSQRIAAFLRTGRRGGDSRKKPFSTNSPTSSRADQAGAGLAGERQPADEKGQCVYGGRVGEDAKLNLPDLQ
ncbi:hypothetical protein GCM10011499_10200 [Pelagibacterium lentulum]|uniref:Uncharacterized protein n=1 Tax=Pelagibacterium lentulum TaxID=2029865 RepID=A0A916R8N3_9HYPH|nr:hypothetical protein GCM10011499_10200 [Pelagibacterium lentulum]